MSVRSVASLCLVAGLSALAAPASAQLYLNPPRFASGPVDGTEPGIMLPLPGATPAEQRAGLLWSLRSGLNVAALQCQFAPTLLTLDNYNTMLTDHREELAAAFTTLDKYFKRNAKTPREGQSAFDQYGTRVYSGFSTVSAQRTFCLTAASVGNSALWAKRGTLHEVAINRLRELRASQTFTREPQLVNPWVSATQLVFPPNLADACWDKDGLWRPRCDPKPLRVSAR